MNIGGFPCAIEALRFYDASLNRFIQPDSIVPNPGDPQTWNRYSYVGNNPINRGDPTGHRACGDGTDDSDCDGNNDSSGGSTGTSSTNTSSSGGNTTSSGSGASGGGNDSEDKDSSECNGSGLMTNY